MNITAIRFRSNEEGLVILQVQYNMSPSYSYHESRTWRDAKVEDLLEASEFCKSDTLMAYESITMQLTKLRNDIFNRLAPATYPHVRPLTDEERHQIDALNQHQERDE